MTAPSCEIGKATAPRGVAQDRRPLQICRFERTPGGWIIVPRRNKCPSSSAVARQFTDFVRYPFRAYASSALEGGHGNADANDPYRALGNEGWRRLKDASPERIQWDPERNLSFYAAAPSNHSSRPQWGSRPPLCMRLDQRYHRPDRTRARYLCRREGGRVRPCVLAAAG
jgi:hypothetical protein